MKIFAYAMFVKPDAVEVVSTNLETDRFNSLVATSPYIARGAEGIMYIVSTEGFSPEFKVDASVLCAKADARSASSFFIRQTDQSDYGLHPYAEEFAKQADFGSLNGLVNENRHHARLRNFAGYHSPFYLLLAKEPLNFVAIGSIMDKAGFANSGTKFEHTIVSSAMSQVEEEPVYDSRGIVTRLTFDNRQGAIYFNTVLPLEERVYNLPDENSLLVRDLSGYPTLLSSIMPSMVVSTLVRLDKCRVSDIPFESLSATVVVEAESNAEASESDYKNYIDDYSEPDTSIAEDSTVEEAAPEEDDGFDRYNVVADLIDAAYISKAMSKKLSDDDLKALHNTLEDGPDASVKGGELTTRARLLVRGVHDHLVNEFAELLDSDINFFALRPAAKKNILAAYNIDLYGLKADSLEIDDLDSMENLVLRVSQSHARASDPNVVPFLRVELVGSYLRGN